MDPYQGPPVQNPEWTPYPPPPRRTPVGGLIATLVVIGLLVAVGVTLGRSVVSGSSADPIAGPASPPVPAPTSTVPSGRRPGVVDIDTELGLRNLRAAGTGIVLNSTGTILTNNHVIAGATSISVTDTDTGDTYKAHVVGYARSRDLAVIQLQNAHGLPVAAIGDSRELTPGAIVTAVGNAGGKGGQPAVVTGSVIALDQGIVATDQSDGSSEQLTGLIQTSAPIKPGDSGGPLLDSAGKVIGIDTAATVGFHFQSSSGGQGYAIPTAKAMPVIQQIENGTSSSIIHIGPTAMLGVQVRAAGNPSSGATVVSLFPGTPAEAAGLPAGAVITSLDGRPVDSPNTLTDLLLAHHPGDTVHLGWTDQTGQQRTLPVTLGDGPPQ